MELFHFSVLPLKLAHPNQVLISHASFPAGRQRETRDLFYSLFYLLFILRYIVYLFLFRFFLLVTDLVVLLQFVIIRIFVQVCLFLFFCHICYFLFHLSNPLLLLLQFSSYLQILFYFFSFFLISYIPLCVSLHILFNYLKNCFSSNVAYPTFTYDSLMCVVLTYIYIYLISFYLKFVFRSSFVLSHNPVFTLAIFVCLLPFPSYLFAFRLLLLLFLLLPSFYILRHTTSV